MISHLNKLAQSNIVREFSDTGMILYQGEAPRSACLLLDGVVKVYSISPQGDEQIITFHIAGEFFPSSWIFGKAPNTMFFYEALTNCRIGLCPRKDLIDFMLSDPERMHAMLDYFTRNYSAFMVRVHALEQSKARDKLINTLYFLCQRYVKNLDPNKKITIPIHLTHQHLASLVGLTRETTAIEMNKLKKEKLIHYSQQRYVVDIQRLFDLMGEETFRNITIAD